MYDLAGKLSLEYTLSHAPRYIQAFAVYQASVTEPILLRPDVFTLLAETLTTESPPSSETVRLRLETTPRSFRGTFPSRETCNESGRPESAYALIRTAFRDPFRDRLGICRSRCVVGKQESGAEDGCEGY